MERPDTGDATEVNYHQRNINQDQDSECVVLQRRAESERKWVSDFPSWGLNHARAAKAQELQRGG